MALQFFFRAISAAIPMIADIIYTYMPISDLDANLRLLYIIRVLQYTYLNISTAVLYCTRLCDSLCDLVRENYCKSVTVGQQSQCESGFL